MRVDASSKESNIIRKLKFAFLYAKYYLYNQKLIHGELSVNEFIVNLKHYHNITKAKRALWLAKGWFTLATEATEAES